MVLQPTTNKKKDRLINQSREPKKKPWLHISWSHTHTHLDNDIGHVHIQQSYSSHMYVIHQCFIFIIKNENIKKKHFTNSFIHSIFAYWWSRQKKKDRKTNNSNRQSKIIDNDERMNWKKKFLTIIQWNETQRFHL